MKALRNFRHCSTRVSVEHVCDMTVYMVKRNTQTYSEIISASKIYRSEVPASHVGALFAAT